MRRLSGVLLAGAILLLPAFSHGAFAQQAQQAAPQKTTYTGQVVLAAYVVNPDKTADYEKVMAQLKDALSKSTRPEAKQQLAGWKVVKMSSPGPEGTVIYTHVITPVNGADYNLLQIMYAVFTDPAEQKALYDLYAGSLAKNLGIGSGKVAVDLSK